MLPKVSTTLKQICKYGDGFNIEGGNLSKLLHPNQKWMNMCMVLDRPFIDKKTLAEITKDNTYSLKEMSILNYDEGKVNMAVLLIINYFVKQNKCDESMLIQIHRGSSGITQINIFCKMIEHLWWGCSSVTRDKNKFLIFSFSNGFKLKFINGYTPNKIVAQPDYTILFSLSLMGD